MIFITFLIVLLSSLVSSESDECHQLRCDMEKAYISCDIFWSEKFCSQIPVGKIVKSINPDFTLSCPMHEVCAHYLLGTKGELGLSPAPDVHLQNCPNYPPLGETYLAPSICLNEFMTATSIMTYSIAVFNQTGKFLAAENYLTTDMSENCVSSCFLNYQWTTLNYFNKCFSEIATGAINNAFVDIPFFKLSLNQQFRGQSCQSKTTLGESSTIDNCYMNFLAGVAALAPTFNISASISYKCDDQLDVDKADAICSKVFGGSRTQCCSGASTSFFLQQTTNATFPPCLNEYLTNNCPGYNPDLFCESGVISPINTLTGSATITTNNPSVNTLPNIYDENNVNRLRFAIGNAVVPVGFIPNLNNSKAETVTITSYQYIDANGTVIPSTFGSTSDYTSGNAVSLSVSYQVTIGWTAYNFNEDDGTAPSNGDVTLKMQDNNLLTYAYIMQLFPGNMAASSTVATQYVKSDQDTTKYNSAASRKYNFSFIITFMMTIISMAVYSLF